MKSRPALVAWIACAATATLGAARLGLAIADPESSSSAGGPLVPGGGIPMAACEATVLLLLGVIGAVVTARHPRNAIGWILCVIPTDRDRPGGGARPRAGDARSRAGRFF